MRQVILFLLYSKPPDNSLFFTVTEVSQDFNDYKNCAFQHWYREALLFLLNKWE